MHQIAGIEVALRADPDVVADHAASVESTLEVGLCADEHAVADLEGLQVLEADAAADLHAVAEPPATARQMARRNKASILSLADGKSAL